MKLTLAKIYFLMADLENGINVEEETLKQKIMKLEDVPESIFELAEQQHLEHKNINEKTADCIQSLEQLNEVERTRCLAWMSLIANADGNLGDKEWDLIADLYIDVFDISVRDVVETKLELASKLNTI